MPKFRDIPKFPSASYSVNVPWAYMESNWLSGNIGFPVEINPPYQRGYKWSDYQKTAYVEFLLKGGRSGKEILWNCANWNEEVVKEPWGYNFELVDGKQRISAVLDFLHDRIKVFDYFYSQYEDNLHTINHVLIFLVNNLKDRKEVVQWYLAFNTGGSIHTEEDLKPAYDYLKTLENDR